MRLERLEVRRLLVAEGDLLRISQTFDTTGLLGELSASVLWGDGSQTTGTVTGAIGAGRLQVKFDYSLDTAGFFTSSRRALLNTAVDVVLSQITDELAAIGPAGNNRWTALPLHPETGQSVSIANPQIAANELLIFVGSQNLASTLATGGPGGFQASGTPQWLNTVQGRGQSGALASVPTDFGPWGGSLSFNSSTNWFFGTDASQIGSNQFDFLSVATHEFIHLLGFGTAQSWSNQVSGDRFTGVKSRAAHDFGGNPPLSADRAHWVRSLSDQGRPTLMDPLIQAGSRKLVTPLDMAALDDIGWELAVGSAIVTAGHVYPDNGAYGVEVTLKGSRLGRLSHAFTASVTNVSPTLTLISDRDVVSGQRFSFTDLGRISDPGYANPLASPPSTETFTYTINWGDGSAPFAGSAPIDRVGREGVPTLASFDGSHTYTAAGIFTVTVTVTDDDGGAASGMFRVTATDPPRLSVALSRTSIAEDAGIGAANLSVSRPASAADSALTILLSSSDTSEAIVPASINLAMGQLTALVAIDAVDDDLLDGPQLVMLTASASGFESGSVQLVVTDSETITAIFSAAVLGEDAPAGSVLLTVGRSNTDTQAPLSVSVSINDVGRIALPGTVVIPAGSQQVVVPVTAIDDDVAQRPQLLQYRVTAAGYIDAELSLTLLDDEPPLFQNPDDFFDVDRDGQLQPLDALRILSFLAGAGGAVELDPSVDSPDDRFFDVNGDYQVTPLDALLVLIEIGRRRRLAEASDAEQVASGSDAVMAPATHRSQGTTAAPHALELRPPARPRVTEASHLFDSSWLLVPFQKRLS